MMNLDNSQSTWGLYMRKICGRGGTYSILATTGILFFILQKTNTIRNERERYSVFNTKAKWV